MNKKEAIEFLKRSLHEISNLIMLPYDNQDYPLWYKTIEGILEEVFGRDSSEYKEFSEARVYVSVYGHQQEEYREELKLRETAILTIINKHEILGVYTPESHVTTPRFSTRTLGCIVEILAWRTDSELRNFFFKYDLLDTYKQSGRLTAKKRKINDVFQHLYTVGDEIAAQKLDSIVREALRDAGRWLEAYRDGWQSFSQTFPELEASLRADGYQVRDGDLVPAISTYIEPVKEEGLVEKLLGKFGFVVAKTHLEQSHENYLDGNWEASNGALRSFLQDVFDQIALKLWPEEAAKKGAGGARRKLLQEKGFIDEDTEADLVRSFFKYAHGEGSHPGISDESDCRLRRYIAVALASYYLEKLREFHA